MGFIKNIIGIEEDDELEEFEELEEEFEEEKPRKPLFQRRKKEEDEAVEPKKPAAVTPSAPISRPIPSQPKTAPEAKTRSTMSGTKYTDQMKMLVIKPQSFEESPKLVDSLKSKKPVIINLEDLETDVARKIFDFLSGATYALNGKVQKIANNIFIFSPDNFDVSYQDSVKKADEPIKSIWETK